MEKQPTMVVMMVRPGPLHSSIQALLNTMPQIQIVAEVKEVSALLQMNPEIRPDLVLMEAGLLGRNIEHVLKTINMKWASTKLMILVEDDAQQEMAEKGAADVVLFKGFRAARFVEAIETLLVGEAPTGAGR